MPLPPPANPPTIHLPSSQTPAHHYTSLPPHLEDIPLHAEDDDNDDDALHGPCTTTTTTTTYHPSYEDDENGADYAPWTLLNLAALALVTLGVVGEFVGVPVVAFLRRAGREG